MLSPGLRMDRYGFWLNDNLSPPGPSPSLTATSDNGIGLHDGEVAFDGIFDFSLDSNDIGDFSNGGLLMYRTESPPESLNGSFTQDSEPFDTTVFSEPIDAPCSAPNGPIVVPEHWGSTKGTAELETSPVLDPNDYAAEGFFDQEMEFASLPIADRQTTGTADIHFQYTQQPFDLLQPVDVSVNGSLLTTLFHYGQSMPETMPVAMRAPPELGPPAKSFTMPVRKASEKLQKPEKSRVTKQRSRASSVNSASGNTATNSNILLYGYKEGSENLRFIEGSNLKKPKGRKTALTPEQRRGAARVREMGACQSCKDRKCKCDETVPCQACIRHYKTDLIYKPCRGFVLNSLVAALICAETFPTSRSLDRFLGSDGYGLLQEVQPMRFSLGFGEGFTRSVSIVVPLDLSQLSHEHVVYPWPPKNDGTAVKTHVNHDVLPVIFTRTDNLLETLDQYLDRLVEDPENFRSFPIYASQLGLLRQIYMFRRRLQKPEADMLKQALKALVLVHTAGDIKVDADDPVVRTVMEMYGLTDVASIKPCFVRGQLGTVMPQLAKQLMETTLLKMEPHLYSRDSDQWPLVLATFMVLLMTIESIQYHAAKEAYHALLDHSSPDRTGPSFSARTGPHNSKIDDKTAICLLELYSKCFKNCHKKLTAVGPKAIPPLSIGSQTDQEACDRFIHGLRGVIERCQPYLEQRSELTVDDAENLTVFFDRLLAKLLLLKC